MPPVAVVLIDPGREPPLCHRPSSKRCHHATRESPRYGFVVSSTGAWKHSRLQSALLTAGAILVPLAGLAALPMAVGMAMTPTDRHALVDGSNPYLQVLFWVMVTAIASIFAAWASDEAALRSTAWARFSTAASAVAVVLAALVLGVFAAESLA